MIQNGALRIFLKLKGCKQVSNSSERRTNGTVDKPRKATAEFNDAARIHPCLTKDMGKRTQISVN